jgi:hypothetical protein
MGGEITLGEQAPRIAAHQERAIGPVTDEVLIKPPFGNHRPGNTKRQRSITPGTHPQPQIGSGGQAGAAWVHHH